MTDQTSLKLDMNDDFECLSLTTLNMNENQCSEKVISNESESDAHPVISEVVDVQTVIISEFVDVVENLNTEDISEAMVETTNVSKLITYLQHFKEIFNSNDFFSGLILSLAPTAWEVSMDFIVGFGLENSGEAETAGLCYLIICLPICWIVFQRIAKILGNLSILIFAAVFWISAYVYYLNPTIFKYPAMVSSLLTLGVKIISVFIHNSQIKLLSMSLSEAEWRTESIGQYLLFLYVWILGGEIYLTGMVSSIILIGKVTECPTIVFAHFCVCFHIFFFYFPYFLEGGVLRRLISMAI